MSKETPVKSVTGSKPKGKKFNNFKDRGDFAKKDTPPYNDVNYYDSKKKEWIVLAGISEEEKIAEGSRPELQHSLTKIVDSDGVPKRDHLGNYKTIGRFEKNKAEREALKAVHTHKKHTGVGEQPQPKKRDEGTLVVHLANLRRKVDFVDFKAIEAKAIDEGKRIPNPTGFKTTYSFKNITEGEILAAIGTVVRLSRNNHDDKVLNYVNKYYFKGKAYLGNGNRG